MHTVYFGETFEDVNTATGGSPGIELTHDPGPLAKETTYFWRVDEFDGTGTIKGDVWSFTTMMHLLQQILAVLRGSDRI